MAQLKCLFLAVVLCIVHQGSAEWRWKGKVAVVTGASSGIGAAIAQNLAENGVIVVALARREDKLIELANKTKGVIHPRKCDLLKENDVIDTFNWVQKELGGVDILVNNAGGFTPSSLVSGNTSDWRHTVELNLLSAAVCTREALKTMRNRGDDGHIINMNSIAGHRIPRVSGLSPGLYPSSKFGITAATQVLAFELADIGSKIKVTSVSPGFVSTEIIEKQSELIKKLGKFPYIEPVDIAEGVFYILNTRPNVQIPELTIQHVWGNKV